MKEQEDDDLAEVKRELYGVAVDEDTRTVVRSPPLPASYREQMHALVSARLQHARRCASWSQYVS